MEHFFAAVLQFDRSAAFLRQNHRDRFEINDGLAAETAADLCRYGLDVARCKTGNYRGHAADHELALAAAPDNGLGVGLIADHASLRLDIALMHRFGLEVALDDQIRLGEAFFDVASFDRHDVGNICRTVDAVGCDPIVQNRCIRGHGLVDIDDMRQHVIVDFD